MRLRVAVNFALMTVLFLVSVTSLSEAVEFHIRKGGSGLNVFNDLESFRVAMESDPSLVSSGDVIVIHNDDNSLTFPLMFNDGYHITIRSDGGMHTITGAGQDAQFAAMSPTPGLRVENVRVVGNRVPSAAVVNFANTQITGTIGYLDIVNSVFDGNEEMVSGSIAIGGNVVANITNTTITNSSGYLSGAMAVRNSMGDNTTVNINVNLPGAGVITWSGNKTGLDGAANSILLDTQLDGTVTLNINTAANNVFDLRDPIMGQMRDGGHIALNKTGAGVWKVDGLNTFGNVTDHYTGTSDLIVHQGTFHARANTMWVNLDGGIYVKPGAVFKPTLEPGNLGAALYDPDVSSEAWIPGNRSFFFLDSFVADNGALLEIGNISMFPELGVWRKDPERASAQKRWEIVMGIGYIMDPGSSTIPASMSINNQLLEADFYLSSSLDLFDKNPDPATIDSMALHIKRVENLAVLDGVGSYADVYRMLPTLTDAERDALDTIYARGGAGAYMGHLQTIGGAVVQYASLAMRHNFANLMRNINRRATRYQSEDLESEAEPGPWCYTDTCEINDYGEIWAYIDQNWIDQDDTGAMAGYRYNPYGIGIGYDKHCDQWIYGGVLRYDTGDMKLKAHKSTKTEVDTLLASLYASWANEGYYLTGAGHLGYGWNDSFSSYTMPGLVATGKGDFNTSLYGLSAEGGYMWETGTTELPLRVTPFAGLAYARINREAFTERGAGSLNRRFAKTDWDLWDFTAGFRVATPIERDTYTLIPSLEAAFVRTMGSPESGGHDVIMLSNPAAAWDTELFGKNRSALRLSASLTARFKDNLDVAMGYEFEWRKQATNHQLNINMSKGF